MRRVLSLWCLLLSLPLVAMAASPTLPIQANPYIDGNQIDYKWANLPSMNGYNFSYFRGFERWQLVTVRYRRDTGEMRFTYANPLAWEVIRKGQVNYPDGAIFAKFSALTEDDPDFINSAVPSGKSRYQFMVRDSKRFKSTEGWGYVIFGANQLTMPGNPKAIANACNACHLMIPEKGYVFSEPLALTGAAFQRVSRSELPAGRVPFTIVTTKSLPKHVTQYLPSSFKEVRLVQGPMTEHLFGGTLDEIRPTLMAEAKRTNHPVLLMSKDKTLFSAAWPVAGRSCTNTAGQPGTVYGTIRSVTPDFHNPAMQQEFCW